MTKSGQQIVLSLGAAAVAILLLAQHHTQSTLQEQNQSLQKRLDQMAQLAEQNERLSNKVVRLSQSEGLSRDQLNELISLRKEVATLRQEKKTWQNQRASQFNRPATPRQAVATVTKPVAVPRESWAFSGYATPEAALQTVLWAMSQGKIDTYRSSMTTQGRELFTSQVGSKPDSQIAAALAAAIRDLTELPIDEKRVSADGTVSYVIGTHLASDENADGTTVQTQEDVLLHFQNVGGQWKYSPE